MKIGPVSGDLLIKIGLGVLLLGGLGMVIWTIKGRASAVASSINPVNPDNIFAGTVNGVGNVVVAPDGNGRNADGSWTLGGWLFDTFNPAEAQAVRDITAPTRFAPAASQNAMNYSNLDGSGNQY